MLLRLFDQLNDLALCAVDAEPLDPDFQRSFLVDRSGGNPVADGAIDGNALAGEHRLVDRALAFLHDAVSGDHVARPDENSLAGAKLIDGNLNDLPIVR